MASRRQEFEAHICGNGHLVTPLGMSWPDETIREYCTRCGERVYNRCQACNSRIPGHIVDWGLSEIGELVHDMGVIPNYCRICGCPYPWTEMHLKTLQGLAEHTLDEEGQKIVQQNAEDILQDTPRTRLASLKIKRAVEKTGPVAIGVFRDLFVEIASETAKKVLLGP